jgi:hypothetical protein
MADANGIAYLFLCQPPFQAPLADVRAQITHAHFQVSILQLRLHVNSEMAKTT